MDKKYQHQQFEDKIYALWEKQRVFSPQGKKAYCIIMPPPNANDPLHLGHAMFVTIEDVLIRYHRMLGEAALWLPGTDHAGIETQYVFEKKLKKIGKKRSDFDRATLYQMIWDYVEENSGKAIEQMKKLGASADWSRKKFTLDDEVVNFVLATFEKMHQEGLVYRDWRLVNYCTYCGTGYSDLEVIHKKQTDPLYYVKYGPVELATVRPETKFGDTAVAVHPADKRYRKYIGKKIEVEGLLGAFKIKVIADESVDPEFGTGVVKITPAHDFNDFEVWQRHKSELPTAKQVIDFNGKLNQLSGPYAGLGVHEARKKVADDLKNKGLLSKIDHNYQHNVGVCYRCGRTIEPLPMSQFFIKVNDPKKSLTKMALKAIDRKQSKIYGAGHDKILKYWLKNLKDWNISRQIVWGIRLPVWYCLDCNADKINISFIQNSGFFKSQNNFSVKQVYYSTLIKQGQRFEDVKKKMEKITIEDGAKYMIGREKPEKCRDCGRQELIQDPDTFDTWFSSSQWPVVTLKTGKKGDFEKFYPTQLMETAYDILIFWVMRMMMMGIYLTGKSPFEKVYLHGLVRDERGQKMSKSKGNVIDPLSIVEKYGADALRMSLVMSTAPGQDSNTGEGKIRGMRNFTNKIWNASRFILMKLNQVSAIEKFSPPTIYKDDKQVKEKLNNIIRTSAKQLDELRVGLAAETVYKEFWHWYCDEVIEKNKQETVSLDLLIEALVVFLKLLHPFVPFVSEAIYQELKASLPKKLKILIAADDYLITANWPAELK